MNWKTEFCNILFSQNQDPKNFDKANRLKFKKIPKSLFRFRSWKDHSIKEISENKIWLSNPRTFNDPYDCFVTADYKKVVLSLFRKLPQTKNIPEDTWKEIWAGEDPVLSLFRFLAQRVVPADLKYIENARMMNLEVKSQVANREKSLDGMKDETKVACFSERWDSLPMWAHYTDQHQGFCIEYDLSKESEGKTAPLFPVIYTKALVPLDITNDLLNLPGNSGHLAIKAAIFKNKDWSYEREWRLVFYTGDDQKIEIKGYPIKAIYLGTKITDEHKIQLIQLSKKERFKIFQMKVSANEFKREKFH
jgi:hypothetical protein